MTPLEARSGPCRRSFPVAPLAQPGPTIPEPLREDSQHSRRASPCTLKTSLILPGFAATLERLPHPWDHFEFDMSFGTAEHREAEVQLFIGGKLLDKDRQLAPAKASGKDTFPSRRPRL